MDQSISESANERKSSQKCNLKLSLLRHKVKQILKWSIHSPSEAAHAKISFKPKLKI